MGKKRGNGRGSSSLKRKAKRGMRGYPLATIAYYGPNDRFASKVAVGIIKREGGDVAALERWYSDDVDARRDADIIQAIHKFMDSHGVKSVLVTEGIIGCPHEEGIDYPLGESCPECPFWENRDRWANVRSSGECPKEPQVSAVVGCPWFDPAGWERLRKLAADPERLGDDYESWVEMVDVTIEQMRGQGIKMVKVPVDVDELVAWCEEQDRPVDAEARATFVTGKLRERDLEG